MRALNSDGGVPGVLGVTAVLAAFVRARNPPMLGGYSRWLP